MIPVRRLSVGSAVLLLPAIMTPAAYAVDEGVGSGAGGVSAGSVILNGVTFTGSCTNERVLSPVGNGGITYEVQAAGSAVGAQVTQVNCFAYQDGNEYQMYGGWTEGDAGEVTGAFSSFSADVVDDCWQINAFINGQIMSTPEECNPSQVGG